MSRSAQDELNSILDKLGELDELKEEFNNISLDSIVDDWLDGSNHVWKIVEVMSEQLQRYIDENYFWRKY